MRVLFLTDGVFPFVVGGMQQHSRNLSIELSKLDVQIDLVHCGGHGYSKDKFVQIFGNSIREIVVPFPKPGKLPGHYVRESKNYSRLIFVRVQPEIKSYDIIYAQGFTGYEFVRSKREFGAKIFVNFHGLNMFESGWNLRSRVENSILRTAAKKCLTKADFVYSFGGAVSDRLLKLGIEKDKILLQSNAISTDWLLNRVRENHPQRSFVFVGRYSKLKGLDELSVALHRLISEDVNFVIKFIGFIPAKKQLINPVVSYLNEVRSVEEIKSILDSSDCLICPSWSEGMPTVILEAMARGLAIIATDVGAVARTIDGNGILIRRPDPDLISSAMRQIIEMSDENLIVLKKHSVSLVRQHFLWENIAKQKLRDFEMALGISK